MSVNVKLPTILRKHAGGEARVEADAVLGATEKARKFEAFQDLTEEERQAIDQAINDLLTVYNGDNYHLIRDKIDQLDVSTQKLAEVIMNTAVGSALKGTKIDEADVE